MRTIGNLFIVISLGVVLLASCHKDDNEETRADARIEVTVSDNDGNKIPAITVKMYDEAAYREFENNNLTAPTTSTVTNSQGVATFNLDYDAWFLLQKDRLLRFVVQFGGGNTNYQIWSAGRTVRPGETVKVDLKLTNYP